jgi:hypothetical protein
MDPLMVQSRIRELLDTFLRYLEPVAQCDLLSDKAPQFLDVIHHALRHVLFS